MKKDLTFNEALKIAQEVFEELQSKYRSEIIFGKYIRSPSPRTMLTIYPYFHCGYILTSKGVKNGK